MALLPAPEADAERSASLHDVCLAFLLENQNADGGWGYQPGSQSATEPTSWAVMALCQLPLARHQSPVIGLGARWLTSTQLENGAWPARTGQPPACWTTALAASALYSHPGSMLSSRRGVQWLCDSWPAEGSVWWRLRHRFHAKTGVTRQDSSLRGWSWIPGTASWVEPTAYSLMLLNVVPASEQPANARERRMLSERMLYNRMCPGGGWNNGNPMVYGIAGEPRVGPTAWALLALKAHSHRPEIRQSLEWLERRYPQVHGPASTALAYLCLKSCGRTPPAIEARVRAQFEKNRFLQNTLVPAWVLVALNQ